jgi:hypothetical protein
MVNIILKMVEPSDYFQDEIPPVIKVISVISWRPVLLVEETGVPGNKDRPAASSRLVRKV